MREGVDYLTFRKPGQKSLTQIDSVKLMRNYDFWKKKFGIESDPSTSYPEIFLLVNKLLGNHTFPFRIFNGTSNIYPVKEIFNFKNGGLISQRVRGGSGIHMKTAIELSIDNFVFSYLGTHDPYHRQYDAPPIMPFGLFLDASTFAFTHGNLCDRDYKKNDQVEKDEIEYYFLKMEDLRKIITWRIVNDKFFASDFWKYFGKENYWDDQEFVDNHWKKKAEMCFFNRVPLQFFRAILWPVWEEGSINQMFTPDALQELALEIKDYYKHEIGQELNIIYYRPYGEIINEENWHKSNLRDWQYNLIKASSEVQEYFNIHNVFPKRVLNNEN